MSAQRTVPPDIERRVFDVIVIGAGINGAGIARDAAMRGLDVLLLEKHDIGSGTTAASTRLIHGGLRYLEHAELGLVRESLRERETLLRIAPHLVRPLPFLLPIYNWHERGPKTIRAGMVAYDLFSARKRLPRHQMLSTAHTRSAAPGLAPQGLRGAARYYDAQVTFPERLALENALDAAAYGATIVTHAAVERVNIRERLVTSVDARSTIDDARFTVHASTVVNATGPWADQLLTGIDSARLIGGTKGSHIVIERFQGAPDDAVYSEAKEDGRPFFIIPWSGWLLIGTTDTPFDSDPGDARTTLADVDYLIRQTTAIFPSARLTRGSVRFAYAGVRPLPMAAGRAAGATTRRHFIRHHAPRASGLYSVIGGKLTTYRDLAEGVTDLICRRVGHGDSCRTSEVTLPGFGDTTIGEGRMLAAGVRPVAIERLTSIYGARVDGLSDLIETDATLSTPFGDDDTTLSAEVVFAVEREFAGTIADVLLRRTMLGLRPGLGLD
ncbi:MAG: glycerol-3-phosphate dehydrogenase, partial [Thermomicrobiales bacterium]